MGFKTIVITGVLGVFSSLTFAQSTTKQVETTTQNKQQTSKEVLLPTSEEVAAPDNSTGNNQDVSEQEFMRKKIYDKYKIKDPALIERNKKEQVESSSPNN